jgi:hypothetical protein
LEKGLVKNRKNNLVNLARTAGQMSLFLVQPLRNHPLGWSHHLFTAGCFGNFVHLVDRSLANKVSRRLYVSLTQTVIGLAAAPLASGGAIELGGGFHGKSKESALPSIKKGWRSGKKQPRSPASINPKI